MQYSEIMVRYGELSTKGKNRMRFINKLKRNIQAVLSVYPQVHVMSDRDRTHVYLHGTDYQPVAESLKQIFGIQNFSPSYKIEKSVPALIEAVQSIMKEVYQEGMTFKITSKRSDHSFELDSRELNQTLGNAVFEAIPNVQVKMKAPDIELRVEIREEAAYISYETIRGAGGLPVGTSGKGMLMLSGGIDSPVAGYLALKRGVDIEAVHVEKSSGSDSEINQVWRQHPVYRSAFYRDSGGNQGQGSRSLPDDTDPSLYDAYYGPDSRGAERSSHYQRRKSWSGGKSND